jgi:hypothetical protein
MPPLKVSCRKALALVSGSLILPQLATPAVAGRASLRFGSTPVFPHFDLELLGTLKSYVQRTTMPRHSGDYEEVTA